MMQKGSTLEHYLGIMAANAGCVCCAHMYIPCQSVAATCSVKMTEPVGRIQPEPEAEPGAGTSVSGSDSSKSNPKMLQRALKR